MKNKRIKSKESDEEESDPPLLAPIAVTKKKKLRGVSDADLKKTEKIKIQKKLSGFSDHKDLDQRDLLSDIPSTVAQVSYRNTNQIEEIDLYKEYREKILHERVTAKERFLLELEKMWKKEKAL